MWTITFREIFGDLPELVPDTLKLTGSIAVSTVVNGTKGNFECSKKGVCSACAVHAPRWEQGVTQRAGHRR